MFFVLISLAPNTFPLGLSRLAFIYMDYSNEYGSLYYDRYGFVALV